MTTPLLQASQVTVFCLLLARGRMMSLLPLASRREVEEGEKDRA